MFKFSKLFYNLSMKKLYETLNLLSKEQDKTQLQLAKYLGYTKGAVNQWFTGITEPNIETLIKIAKFYNVSLNFLLTGEEINSDYIMIKKSKYNKIISISKNLLDVLKED